MLKNFHPLFRITLVAFLFITVIVVFVPFTPYMPSSGLDPSWVYGTNQAVAQHLVFGRDFIFTTGPYGAVYTQTFHPDTDHLMLIGSLYLAICYGLVLMFLMKEAPLRWLLILSILLAGFNFSRDTLLSLYPLLIALFVFKLTLPDSHKNKTSAPTSPLLWLSLLFSPLGLLPLVKGSFLPLCVAITILCLIFLYKKDKKLAAISVLIPLFSMIFFWLISGQSIYGLPYFFLNSYPIISGYSEAMSSTGGYYKEIPLYILAASGILFAIITSRDIPHISRIFLCIPFALFLFISFKHGFVRHDAHAITASSAIIISAILLAITLRHKYLIAIFLLSILSWAYIDKNYVDSSTKSFFENIKNTYIKAYDGLKIRMFDRGSLYENFNNHLLEISKEGAISRLNGTTDIYSFNQSYLLASGNKWSPRPIFQSYSAYTPHLIQINEQHILGKYAPDNIIFKIEPIDGRLASLEDGLSWPIIIHNYEPFKLENNFIYLKKRALENFRPIRTEILNEEYQIGEIISLPDIKLPLFVEMDIRQTFLGHLLSFLYKPIQLQISIELNNGLKKNYRLISNMAKTGFLLSPLVENTTDFAHLFSVQNLMSDKRVKSIRVLTSDSTNLLWKTQYRLKLSSFKPVYSKEVYKLFKFNTIHRSIPAQTIYPSSSVKCEGVIDWINEIPSSSKEIHLSEILNVDGWLALSTQEGIVPERIFVTLTDALGKTQYIETRHTPRNDVKNHFNQPNMPDVGYETSADISQLTGNYVLGLSRIYNRKLEHCQNINIPVRIQ